MSSSVNNNTNISLYLAILKQQIQKNMTSSSTSTQDGSDQSDLLSGVSFKAKSAVDVQISRPSQFMQYADSLSDTDKQELKSYMDEVRAAIDDGSFDAQALTENAPESLKNFAAQNGESVSDVLSTIKEHHDTMKSRMGSLLGTSSQQNTASSTSLGEFFNLIQKSLSSGDVDMDSLSKNEPEVLKKIREKQGLSFEDMIEKMKSSNFESSQNVSMWQGSLSLLADVNNSNTSSAIMNNILQYSLMG